MMINAWARWTPEEEKFLADNAGKLTPAELAVKLGRTDKAIVNKATSLDISLAVKLPRYSAKRINQIFKVVSLSRTKSDAARALGMDYPNLLYVLRYHRPTDGKHD